MTPDVLRIKRRLRIGVALALAAVALSACAAPAQSPAPAPAPTQTLPEAVVFADPALEAMVRATMGKPDGDITVAEAEAVTELNLSLQWRRYISDAAQIKDIGGLERFLNLECLDLSFHAIPDIAPLAGLKKLTSLSLGGNPVADIAPLAGLTNLKGLTLSNCAAQDYSPLEKLVDLEFLMLDNSTIADVSPLASLTSLKRLYLAGCALNGGFSPLADIYPNLEDKDFTIVSMLSGLGFIMHDGNHQADYAGEGLSVSINHSAWGAAPRPWDANCIRLSLQLEGGYTLNVGYYAEINAYVSDMVKDGEQLMNYVYDAAKDSFTGGMDDRESIEAVVRAALGETDCADILLAPMATFNDTILSTFGLTADALYALPYELTTLRTLGFIPDEANAVCVYEQHEGGYTNIEVHRPEWGEKGYDVRFFRPINDYGQSVMGLIVLYDKHEQRFHVTGYLDETSYAEFDYDAKDGSTADGAVAGADTVEEYFISMYGDPAITDVYAYSVRLVEGYIRDTFGMSIDELCALPVGE